VPYQRSIVGIHGLNNKPAPDVLGGWWQMALAEGLHRQGLVSQLPDGGDQWPFRLAYWADLVHPNPVPEADDPAPYVPADGIGALAGGRKGWRRELAALGLEGAGKLAEQLARAPIIDEMLDEAISEHANDLHRYHTDEGLRSRVQDRLRMELDRSDGPQTLLIAHSMGSIIAYDLLRLEPHRRIGHLVSIGSPLGLSQVKRAARQRSGPSRVPDGVMRWTNLADPRDPVSTLDLRLRSDYAANASGVRIVDARARNGYVAPAGKANPHKVYGYLRTPEMATIVRDWLAGGPDP
jgi:hypothetical protein